MAAAVFLLFRPAARKHKGQGSHDGNSSSKQGPAVHHLSPPLFALGGSGRLGCGNRFIESIADILGNIGATVNNSRFVYHQRQALLGCHRFHSTGDLVFHILFNGCALLVELLLHVIEQFSLSASDIPADLASKSFCISSAVSFIFCW